MFGPDLPKTSRHLVLESMSMTLGDVGALLAKDCQRRPPKSLTKENPRVLRGETCKCRSAVGWAGLQPGVSCVSRPRAVFQGCLRAYCRSWTGMMGPWMQASASGVGKTAARHR